MYTKVIPGKPNGKSIGNLHWESPLGTPGPDGMLVLGIRDMRKMVLWFIYHTIVSDTKYHLPTIAKLRYTVNRQNKC